MNNKTYSGIVVGLRPKTAKIEISWNKKFKKYPKKIKLVKTIQAHNEEDKINLNLGDKVIIESCRPRSKTKRFEVKKIVNK